MAFRSEYGQIADEIRRKSQGPQPWLRERTPQEARRVMDGLWMVFGIVCALLAIWARLNP